MTLSEKVNQDLKAAMKSGDQVKLNTIRSLLAHIIELTKRGTGSTVTADEELSVLMTAAKKRKEAIEMYQKGGRDDLVKQEQKELEIINGYLPKPMTKEEAEEVVVRIIAQSGATSGGDFGKVMPLAMKELKGKIDGKIVQDVVRQKLAGAP
ncbi:MAG: GatB/YqeY domain-containing protein [Ignavibacteriales bacterium]|nr:GatB/YqeY domain-containing protein [Ignavibacteriales bacterium]